MKRNKKSFARLASAIAALTLFVADGRATTLTFDISDLTFSGNSGQNGWPAPVSISEPGVDGHFDWTYTANNFQSGVGTLVDLKLPITSYPLSNAIVTVTNTGISGTNPGNVQNLSYDWSIVFAQPLTSPTQTTGINPSGSSFDLTGTYLFINGEWLGQITGGTISPTGISTGSSTPEPSMASYFLVGLGLLGLKRRSSTRLCGTVAVPHVGAGSRR